jgi:hypothetical protein
MGLEDLHRHDESILEKVIIHLTVEDVHCAIITAARE